MRPFVHVDATTIEEACMALKEYSGRARLIAGGTDLLSVLKGDFLPEYPEAVINIKTIEGLDYIRENGDALKIGALTSLATICRSPLVAERYGVLAQAARTVAATQIRNVATLGGNLCQDVRCWFYRYPRVMGEPMGCARKGNGPCFAIKGDNRYHAIMKGKKCFAVCPSDMAAALAALDGRIVVTGPVGERKIAPEDFYTPMANALGPGEMVREVEIPLPPLTARQRFLKFTIRKPIDFAIVSVAAVIKVDQGFCTHARIVLGAVAPGPVRAKAAEKVLEGRQITPDSAVKAAEAALSGVKPLSRNAYKVEIAKTLVERIVMSENSDEQ